MEAVSKGSNLWIGFQIMDSIPRQKEDRALIQQEDMIHLQKR